MVRFLSQSLMPIFVACIWSVFGKYVMSFICLTCLDKIVSNLVKESCISLINVCRFLITTLYAHCCRGWYVWNSSLVVCLLLFCDIPVCLPLSLYVVVDYF
jgi:hypothetical protein